MHDLEQCSVLCLIILSFAFFLGIFHTDNTMPQIRTCMIMLPGDTADDDLKPIIATCIKIQLI